MEEHCKSLALQYDLFVNSVLKFLDTTTERDYLLQLKIVNELANTINESEVDKVAIKKALEEAQDECSKLSYKLKTSARLLDDVQAEKENLELEKQNLKSQLSQLYNVFKKTNSCTETPPSQVSNFSPSDPALLDEKKNLNNTDALLSDLSYSQSEDSSYENRVEKSKPVYAQIRKPSSNNGPNGLTSNTKQCEVKSVNINGGRHGGQITATTTLTMDLGRVNAKSVIKTHSNQTTKAAFASLGDYVESISSNESEKESKPKNYNDFGSKDEKGHKFVQKIIVIPEVCDQCHNKIKFNTRMVKCVECKTIAHVECKDLITTICTADPIKKDALNFGVPPLIVYCIAEIERRGLETVGLYRVSGSDKEVKNLREQFRKTVPNLKDVDIHVLCSCLKDFIRTQNVQLVSENNCTKFVENLKKNNGSNLLSKVVYELPLINRIILAFLIIHLQKVALSPKCCMDHTNLAIVFGPTVISVTSGSMDEFQYKKDLISNVLTELLKLSKTFWVSVLTNDGSPTTSDERLHSTPARNEPQSPVSPHRFFTSGLKRRILDSPRKIKNAKQVEFERDIEFTG